MKMAAVKVRIVHEMYYCKETDDAYFLCLVALCRQ